jgi:MerR family transcriptional regulator, mercuric resistance operon regulatory protein
MRRLISNGWPSSAAPASLASPIEDIRTLLALAEPARGSCAEVREIAQAHLSKVRAKLVDLGRLERLLSETVARGSNDPAPSCPVLDALETGRDR